MLRPTPLREWFTGLWLHGDFRRLWFGQTVSLIGSQISELAIPLTAVLMLQASPAQMGFLGGLQYAPWLLVGLFAGVWADRLQRRPLMIAADLGRATLLALVPLVAFLGLLQIEILYLVAFSVGILTVFFNVAYQSFLPSLVPRQKLIEGNSKLTVSRSAAQILGPGLAGWLVQAVTGPVAILLDAASFLVSAASLRAIQTPEELPTGQDLRRGVWNEIGEGLKLVFGEPRLLAIALSVGTINFFVCMILAVYPLYAIRDLELEPASLGAVLAIGSLGFLPGSLLAGHAARWFGVGPAIIAAGILAGCSDLLIPMAKEFRIWMIPLLMAAQGLNGLWAMVGAINVLSLRQAITPDRLQGRVNATTSVLVWGGAMLGSFVGGALGQQIGLQATILVAALGQASAVLWLLFSPVRAIRERSVQIPEAVTGL